MKHRQRMAKAHRPTAKPKKTRDESVAGLHPNNFEDAVNNASEDPTTTTFNIHPPFICHLCTLPRCYLFFTCTPALQIRIYPRDPPIAAVPTHPFSFTRLRQIHSTSTALAVAGTRRKVRNSHLTLVSIFSSLLSLRNSLVHLRCYLSVLVCDNTAFAPVHFSRPWSCARLEVKC